MSQEKISIKTRLADYDVFIEEGLLERAGPFLSRSFCTRRLFLVSDHNVYALYGKKLLKSLQEAGFDVLLAKFKAGENSKTMASANRLYSRAIRAELDRDTLVLALGGGVVGDLAGFVAATYLRGLPLIMVPTTLLAQVDSSVGGKVAVNHRLGKNLIGAFYPPQKVLIDPLTLKTLSGRELKAGLAEVVKYGVIMDELFFKWLEENTEGLLEGRLDLLSQAIAVCVRAKKKVVEEDELEKDYRRILNFGHSFGHALEAATGYSHFLHGEAVLTGMAVAARLAHAEGLLEDSALKRILNLLAKIGFKKAPPGLTAAMVMDKLKQDKKRTGAAGDLVFILPGGLGSVAQVKMPAQKRMAKILNDYL